MSTKEEPSFLTALNELATQVAQGKPVPETLPQYLCPEEIRLCKLRLEQIASARDADDKAAAATAAHKAKST